jgi:hypothetical protein
MDRRLRTAERRYAAEPTDENLDSFVTAMVRTGDIDGLRELLITSLNREDIPVRCGEPGVFTIPIITPRNRKCIAFIIRPDGTPGPSPFKRQARLSVALPDTLLDLVPRGQAGYINSSYLAWEHSDLVTKIESALQPAAEEHSKIVRVVESSRRSAEDNAVEYLNGLSHSHYWSLEFLDHEYDYAPLRLTLELIRSAWRDTLSLRLESNLGYQAYDDDGDLYSSEVAGAMISGDQYREFGFAEPYEEDEPELYAEYDNATTFDLIETLSDIPTLISQYFGDLAAL